MWACAHAPISRCISGWRDMCFRVLAAFNSFIFFSSSSSLLNLCYHHYYLPTVAPLSPSTPPTHPHTHIQMELSGLTVPEVIKVISLEDIFASSEYLPTRLADGGKHFPRNLSKHAQWMRTDMKRTLAAIAPSSILGWPLLVRPANCKANVNFKFAYLSNAGTGK